jgi:hypothetical protein
VFQNGLVLYRWIDGNTVPLTEPSSRLRKNLTANTGLTTVLQVVLPPFSVDFTTVPFFVDVTTILRGLCHRLRGALPLTTILDRLCHASSWELYHHASWIASILLSTMALQIFVCR